MGMETELTNGAEIHACWRTWIPASLLFLFSSLRLSGEDGAILRTEEAFTCSESEWQLLRKKKKRANGQVCSRTALQKFLCLLCAFGGAKKRLVDWGKQWGSYCLSKQRERENNCQVWLCNAVLCGTY